MKKGLKILWSLQKKNHMKKNDVKDFYYYKKILFHYLKNKTGEKKLWIRNNVSTLISQLVDSTAVILITHFVVDGLPKTINGELTHSLIYFILSGFIFKMLIALIDTIPFYYLTKKLKPYI